MAKETLAWPKGPPCRQTHPRQVGGNYARKRLRIGARNAFAARVIVPAGTAMATSQRGASGRSGKVASFPAFLRAIGPGTTATPSPLPDQVEQRVHVVDLGRDLPWEAGGGERMVGHPARAPVRVEVDEDRVREGAPVDHASAGQGVAGRRR